MMADILAKIVESTAPELLATGFRFTEGPLWHPDGYLLFVDAPQHPDNFIYKLAPGGKPEIFRDDAGGANGLTFDLQGRLVICEGMNRQVTRRDADGTIVPIAQRWKGKRINRPNDVVGRSEGSIYFTDPALPRNNPSYVDRRKPLDPPEPEVEFSGVYRIAPDGTLTPEATDMEMPNGLAFSPDERTLYVANTRTEKYIRAFDVKPDGSLENGRIFADMSSDEPEGAPDGMKVDVEGRVYCTGAGGCWVFEPDGTRIGIIRLPEIPANCAWGGTDNRTMVFTARTSVYSLRMRTPGTSIPSPRV